MNNSKRELNLFSKNPVKTTKIIMGKEMYNEKLVVYIYRRWFLSIGKNMVYITKVTDIDLNRLKELYRQFYKIWS